MRINFNVLDRGYQLYKDEYDQAVIKTLESGWYILGDNTKEFENRFSFFIGSKYCVGLNSGLDALILAFRALEIGYGDEVIVPANTYIASVLGITENMATPVFIEPDEFYNLDADKIAEKITKKTKAILVVHLYGQAANLDRVKDIAEHNDLFLIEDCAQSHGARFNQKVTGSWADIGCFSFYPTKNIGAFGDSGAIVTNNEQIFEKIKMLRNYGSRKKYQNEILGINSRLDEIQAALLSVKLSHYDELRKKREKTVSSYLDGIQNDQIILPEIRQNSEHVWHLFVVRINKRDKFQQFLLENEISTQIHYPIPPHLSEAYKFLKYKDGDFPITEKYANTILSLPLFDMMTEEETDYVISVINKFKE